MPSTRYQYHLVNRATRKYPPSPSSTSPGSLTRGDYQMRDEICPFYKFHANQKPRFGLLCVPTWLLKPNISWTGLREPTSPINHSNVTSQTKILVAAQPAFSTKPLTSRGHSSLITLVWQLACHATAIDHFLLHRRFGRHNSTSR